MNLDIGGQERFSVGGDRLWSALNDPAVLARCIPGCRQMTPDGEDQFRVVLDLKVAAVGGSFTGMITLSDKQPPTNCRLTVTGAGTLGHGTGHATFSLAAEADGATAMRYSGQGEVGGAVVGVGQRMVRGVAQHLIGRFFTALRRELGEPAAAASA